MRGVLARTLVPLITDDIKAEYIDKASDPDVVRLFRRHGVSPTRYLRTVEDLCDRAEFVRIQGDPPVSRDENDRKFLHCAQSGAADFLITRDLDLLDIALIGTARILTPGQFVALARQERRDL